MARRVQFVWMLQILCVLFTKADSLDVDININGQQASDAATGVLPPRGNPRSEATPVPTGSTAAPRKAAPLLATGAPDSPSMAGVPPKVVEDLVETSAEVDNQDHEHWAIPTAIVLGLGLPGIVCIGFFCYFMMNFDFTSEGRDANGLPVENSRQAGRPSVDCVSVASSQVTIVRGIPESSNPFY